MKSLPEVPLAAPDLAEAIIVVPPEDLRRVSRLARDLADPDVMREAWS